MSEIDDELEARPRKPGYPVDPHRLWIAFTRDWRWMFAAILIGVFSGAFLIKTMVSRRFVARSTLEFTARAAVDPTARLEAQSLVGSLPLPKTLDRVKELLKLQAPSGSLARLIEVSFDARRSSLVTVSATWSDAEGAAALANALVRSFLEYTEERRKTSSEALVRKLKSELQIVSVRLENFRQIYDAFRNEKGVADVSVEMQLAVEEAARLRFEADQAEAEVSRLQQARENRSASGRRGRLALEEEAEEANERDREMIREQLSIARARLEAVRERLPPDHPTVKVVELEVAELEDKLPARRYRGSTGYRSSLDSATREYQKLDTSARRAEARLRQLAQEKGEVTDVMMDIRVAEQQVERLKSELTRAQAEARDPTPFFNLVARAEAQMAIVQSKRKVVFSVISFGVFFLTVLVFLLRRTWGLRVYTAREAAYWANAPVVGSSSWPRDPKNLYLLVGDLDDFAPLAAGATLVVPMAEEERPLAREIAGAIEQSAATARERFPIPRLLPALKPELPASQSSAAIENLPAPRHTSSSSPQAYSAIEDWTGPLEGPALRRAGRLVDRVLVTVTSGARSALELARLSTRLGREQGVGILLLNLDPDLNGLPDRVGPVEQFWKAGRASKAERS